MKRLSILMILIVVFTVVTACSSSAEDELDATADAYGDSFDAKGGIFDDIGDDIGYVLDGSSEEDIDDRADEIGDNWDDRGDAIDDKYDGGVRIIAIDDHDDVDIDVDVDDDVDIDVDLDLDSDPGGGAPSGAAPDDISYGICNAMNSLENSVDALLNPALTTPEAYAAAFDVAQEDFWTLREAAHDQHRAEFDEIVDAAKDFELLLTSADDVVQRSNIVVQAGRIAYAVNALEQELNCSCSQ